MIVGGRGYHDLRVRVQLKSWARCVCHVLIFTDPSVDIHEYISPYRFVYLAAGDVWRRRPYLPMTHMEGLSRLATRTHSPAANVSWFFLVSDRSFVNVGALLETLGTLDETQDSYFGKVANATAKESFGFHEYIDLASGVLMSASLMHKVADPANCKDQKGAGGTFDMFDAKLGNCIFYLGSRPRRLLGFTPEAPPASCDLDEGRRGWRQGGGLGAAVSYGKVDPEQMLQLSRCASLINETLRVVVSRWVAEQKYALEQAQVSVHVMARETRLEQIVQDCESTWALDAEKVYYHVDRFVAAESYSTISRGRWGISANLLDAEQRRARPDAYHRIAALNLPERPSSQGEHWTISHDKGMNWNTWLRFKMKAIFEYSVKAHWKELQETEWYIYVDDDTYVLMEPLMALLRWYDPRAAHYFGRPLAEDAHPLFVGGGAGIVLSRAAALQIVAMKDSSDCDPLHIKWGERVHQGGDAWLGDCADAAGVHVDMEYGFYPQPPVANLFGLFGDAVSFHGVEDHRAFREALAANASGKAYDPRCVPIFADHKYSCLPHFIIGGVPKAGTTSLYKYLLQHPDVLPAADKELTFWGNFFSPKRRPSREEVMADYLPKFPKIAPSDFKVTGEATPGYLYCITCPQYILKYVPKVKFIFTLRNPVTRAYSEYLNKVADQTVMRYLKKRIDNKMDKELSTSAPSFKQLVNDVASTMDTCALPNRTFSMMDEYSEEMDKDGCYVNPFVGEGRYARHLRLWLTLVPKRQVMLLNFDEWTNNAMPTMEAVSRFLSLPPFAMRKDADGATKEAEGMLKPVAGPYPYKVDEAHNTHLRRSVHVALDGKSDKTDLKRNELEGQLPAGTHCVLHEFFRPYLNELDELLLEYAYPPMGWKTGEGKGFRCDDQYTHWRGLRGKLFPAAAPAVSSLIPVAEPLNE